MIFHTFRAPSAGQASAPCRKRKRGRLCGSSPRGLGGGMLSQGGDCPVCPLKISEKPWGNDWKCGLIMVYPCLLPCISQKNVSWSWLIRSYFLNFFEHGAGGIAPRNRFISLTLGPWVPISWGPSYLNGWTNDDNLKWDDPLYPLVTLPTGKSPFFTKSTNYITTCAIFNSKL